MFNYIDNFYQDSDLGLMVMHFLNLNFSPSYQSQDFYYGGDRMNAYPCYETPLLKQNNNPKDPYNIFKNTFENKTNKKIYYLETFFRKVKKEEYENSASWKQHRPHLDPSKFDFAGLVYYNSNSLKDGTNLYITKNDYEPTAIIGSRFNRCVFYNTKVPHSPSVEQTVEERWTQPFFMILEEETYKKFKQNNAT